jgi:uncharacterized protein (TIGR02391 family)
MNLESTLDTRLFKAIETSYTDRNFTGAILDAVHFLGQLIRDKSGLEADGLALVGQAFGGQAPILKVTKLQTETDWNIQRGVEQLLRGLYQGIRNPRSHEKFTDTNEDADALILFVDHLVKMIDRSSSPFEKTDFLRRVFDRSFPESDRYANLLIEEIPPRQRMNVLIEVFRNRGEGNYRKLRYFFKALMKALSTDEVDQFCGIVSDELKTTDDDSAVLSAIQILPPEYWGKYKEIARIRTEHKMILSIKAGRHNTATGKWAPAGALGTWATGVAAEFISQQEFQEALASKLSSPDADKQDYVFQYFSPSFSRMISSPSRALVSAIEGGLKSGDRRFHERLWWLGGEFSGAAWDKALLKSYEAFTEASPGAEAEPQEITDDDVPF